MTRSLSVAGLVGLLAGVVVYLLLLPNPFVAGGTAAVYAGATYFHLVSEASLLDEGFRFSERPARVGYALGLFGLSLGPMTFVDWLEGSVGVAFLVWVVGVALFFLLAARAQRVETAGA